MYKVGLGEAMPYTIRLCKDRLKNRYDWGIVCTVVLMDSAAETGGLILFTSAFDSGWWVKPKAHRIRHTVALYVARKRISYASTLF